MVSVLLSVAACCVLIFLATVLTFLAAAFAYEFVNLEYQTWKRRRNG